MKTLTIDVSDETAANLETIRDVFMPGENVGRVLDDLVSWYFQDIAANDGGQIFQEVEGLEFDSREEALELADRINSHLEKIEDHVPVCWFTFTNKNDKHELRPLHNEREEQTFDFAVRIGVEYEWAREAVRLKVGDLDEAAGLPPRNWIQNPADLNEVFPLIEADVIAARSQLAA